MLPFFVVGWIMLSGTTLKCYTYKKFIKVRNETELHNFTTKRKNTANGITNKTATACCRFFVVAINCKTDWTPERNYFKRIALSSAKGKKHCLIPQLEITLRQNTLFFSKAFCVISIESNFFKLQGVEHRKLCVENVLHLGFQIEAYGIWNLQHLGNACQNVTPKSVPSSP